MSSTFKQNLDTTLNPSNSYITQTLAPQVNGGDKCRTIIPNAMTSKLNGTGRQGNYNIKKVNSRTERYVWKRPIPPFKWVLKYFNWWYIKGWRKKCWLKIFCYKYPILGTRRYYYWTIEWLPWVKVRGDPRNYCRYETNNELTYLGSNLSEQQAFQNLLNKNLRYLVKDNYNNWFGTNSNKLFQQSNRYDRSDCYGNNQYINKHYDAEQLAANCADMVNKVNSASSGIENTQARENKLYYDITQTNKKLDTSNPPPIIAEASQESPSSDILESFECVTSEGQGPEQDQAVKNIVCDMNKRIKELSLGYDFRARYANNQREILKNSFTSNEIFDKKINKNVNKLDNIANEIMVKDRLIEFNKQKLKDNDLIVKLLKGFFATFVFLTIPFVLYFTNAISLRVLVILVALYFIGYFIYMGVMIRKNKLKKFFKPMFKEMSEYEKAARSYVKKEANRISKELSDFAYGQCNCPVSEEDRPELPDSEVPISEADYEMSNNDGYYYFDGTAPPQKIMPKVQPGPGQPEKYSIDWEVNKEMGVTNSSQGTAPPNWYDIGLPVLSDSMQKIISKCQSRDDISFSENEFIKGIYYLVQKKDLPMRQIEKIKKMFVLDVMISASIPTEEEQMIPMPDFDKMAVRKAFFNWALKKSKLTEKEFMKTLYSRTGDKDKDYKNNVLISIYISLLQNETLTIGL